MGDDHGRRRSGTGRRRAWIRPTLIAALVGCWSLIPVDPASAQNDPENDQRVVSLDATYDIDPSGGVVEVAETITVRNVKGSVRGTTTITSFYWTGHTVWVPADAQDLAILSNGDALEFEVAETIEGIDILSVDYPTRLTFGQTRVLDVSYRLPTYGPDREARRINDALFDLEIIVCCNFEEVSLAVSAPPSFDVFPPDNLRFRSIRGETGTQRFEFTDNETTGRFTDLILMYWSGFDEAGMDRSRVDVAGGGIDVVAPPDDANWAEGVGSLVDGVGVELVGLTGADWPGDGFEIVQGPNDALTPWGLDTPAGPSLTLPRDYVDQSFAIALAQQVMADGPFDDPDLTGGVAGDLGLEALRRTTGARVEPREPNAGARLDLQGSLWVVRQVSDEIGYDGMSELIRIMGTGETAYVGDGDPEDLSDLPGDWRRFLDVAERRLGSTVAADAVATHALAGDGDAAALAERDRAATAYDQLVDRAGVAPVGLRDAMTDWDFERFDALIGPAESNWERIEVLTGNAEKAGQEVGASVGNGWAEAASADDFTALGALIDDRQSELDRNALGRNLLFGAALLAVVAAVAFAVVFLSRRRQQVTVDNDLVAADPGGPQASPPAVGGRTPPIPPDPGPSPEARTVSAPPGGRQPPMPPVPPPADAGSPVSSPVGPPDPTVAAPPVPPSGSPSRPPAISEAPTTPPSPPEPSPAGSSPVGSSADGGADPSGPSSKPEAGEDGEDGGDGRSTVAMPGPPAPPTPDGPRS